MRFLLSLVLVAVIFGSGWVLRGQWDELVRTHKIQLKADVVLTKVPVAVPSALPARKVGKVAKAPEARPVALPGNTDGGLVPWNGGDLYMRDYSPRP